MKDQQSCISIFVACLIIPSRKEELGPPGQTWQQYYMHGPMVDLDKSNLRRTELHRTNQGINFRGGNFSNRDNVRAPIQFRRESQPQHLQVLFFLKNRSIHFHINSTSVIRMVKWNQLSFSSTEINKHLLAPVHSVSYIRFKFRSQF